jgi:type II secretory pathway component GspD/PulD (secretin)
MIRNGRDVMRCAIVLAGMCLFLAPAECAESLPASHGTNNSILEGVVSSDSRFTINVDDVEIAQLLRILSVKRRVNIITGPRVSGKVSVNLYDVTFEEALNSILDVSGCTATRTGNTILVTEASEKGQLPLHATDMTIRVFKLDYVDPNETFDLIREFVSPAGRAIVSSVESTVLVQDTKAYLDRISALVEQIDVPPKQVLIEARLLELTYSDDLTLGVQFDAVKINGETIFRALTNGFAAEVSSLPEGAQGLFAGVITGDTETFLEALAETVDMKTLANPKILAVDNQEAEIIIGDRLGFRITTTTETSSLESVEFIDVGTQLTLTPQISDDGLVLLEVHPEVSSGIISAAGLPSESTAEATTHMLVRDGQTIVLGGLLKEGESERVLKVPLLGDIPWLGHLFRRTKKSTSRSELIVLITPHIVGPEPTEGMQKLVGRVEEMAGVPSQNGAQRCTQISGSIETPPFRPARSARRTENPESDASPPAAETNERITASADPVLAEGTVPARAEDHSQIPGVTGECSIQVFASRSKTVTGDYVRKLSQEGYPAWVEAPDRHTGDVWYRAMIGRFSARSEAGDTLSELKERSDFADAFVRVIRRVDTEGAEGLYYAQANEGTSAKAVAEAYEARERREQQ